MKNSNEFLMHILQEADFLADAVRETSREKFLADNMCKRAFVRSLEVIGEAVKNLPESITSIPNHEIEWRDYARMRDKLIHHYFGVDYEIVWDVVANEIPILGNNIRQMLDKE
jgi:uncharacterized protein with HEPN domain